MSRNWPVPHHVSGIDGVRVFDFPDVDANALPGAVVSGAGVGSPRATHTPLRDSDYRKGSSPITPQKIPEYVQGFKAHIRIAH